MMDRFQTIIQLARNEAILKAEQEMERKLRAAMFSSGVMAHATPHYPEVDRQACLNAAADAAENRLINHLIDVAVGDDV